MLSRVAADPAGQTIVFELMVSSLPSCAGLEGMSVLPYLQLLYRLAMHKNVPTGGWQRLADQLWQRDTGVAATPTTVARRPHLEHFLHERPGAEHDLEPEPLVLAPLPALQPDKEGQSQADQRPGQASAGSARHR